MSDQNPYGYGQNNNGADNNGFNNNGGNNGFNNNGFNPAPAGGSNGKGILGITWEKNYVSIPVPTTPKSNVLAYVLWFFFGTLGAHQYYLGNHKRGLLMLALLIATSILTVTGIPFGIVVLVYWIYEAITLNDQVQEVNSGRIRQSVL